MKKDNKTLYFLIIIFFLILVILIGINVVIHFSYNNIGTTTDVINIEFEEQDNDSNDIKKENEKQDEEHSNLENSNRNNSSINSNKITNSTIELYEDDGNFEINDKKQIWSKTTEIKIFDRDKVSPNDTGEYEFIINNNTIENLKYKIKFIEVNKYNVNMMYKLSRNNEFIAGDKDEWLYYDKLNVDEKVLNTRKNDVYRLEWKWVDADNDTQVGRTKGANYTINVLVEAEETQEIDESANWWNNPRTGDDIVYTIIVGVLSSIILFLIILLKIQKDSDNFVKKD